MRSIPFLLFCIVFALGILLVPTIGPAWDEPDNIVAGGQYANFFQKGFEANILTQTDQEASIFGKMIYSQAPTIARYPPIPNYVGTLFALSSGANTSSEIIIAFHIATVLFFALLVAFVYNMGRLLGLSLWASLFAALVTFLYPTLFGHGLTNIKDTAQVALFTIALYYLAKKHIVMGAAIWGLALATKFNAVYIPIIWMISNFSFARKKLFFFLPIGLLVTFVVWPYLWYDPLPRIGEIISYFTTVGQGYKIYWDGVLYEVGVGKILWWYPWAHLLFATPLPLVILWVFGLKSAIQNPRLRLLVLWFTIPLLRAFFPHAAFYDGMRHFMEILPAGALIAAVGLEQLKSPIRWVVFAGVVSHLMFINITYFPYSTGYLNILAQNPNERFDRDIEALSVKEAVDYLHKRYGAIALWAHIGGHLSWHYLTPPDRYAYPQDADSIILVNKSSHIRQGGPGLPIGPEFALDHVISRGEAVFAWIYRRK